MPSIFSGFGRLFRARSLNAMADRIFSTPPATEGERIAYGDESDLQFGELRLPEGEEPHPLAIVIHGGFWRAKYGLDHAGHLCADLTAHGLATWSLEYRRIGDEGGGWPGTFLDVGAGVDYARTLSSKYALDLDRVVVVGHSAGGHLAAWVAARGTIPEGDALYAPDPLKVKATVPLSGVVDLLMGWQMRLSNNVVTELMGGSPMEVPERYRTASPADMLPSGVRQVLIHGTSDPNVPYEISKAYAARAKSAGDDCTLITLKGAGHFEVIDPQAREFDRVREAVLAEVTR